MLWMEDQRLLGTERKCVQWLREFKGQQVCFFLKEYQFPAYVFEGMLHPLSKMVFKPPTPILPVKISLITLVRTCTLKLLGRSVIMSAIYSEMQQQPCKIHSVNNFCVCLKLSIIKWWRRCHLSLKASLIFQSFGGGFLDFSDLFVANYPFMLLELLSWRESSDVGADLPLYLSPYVGLSVDRQAVCSLLLSRMLQAGITRHQVDGPHMTDCLIS